MHQSVFPMFNEIIVRLEVIRSAKGRLHALIDAELNAVHRGIGVGPCLQQQLEASNLFVFYGGRQWRNVALQIRTFALHHSQQPHCKIDSFIQPVLSPDRLL